MGMPTKAESQNITLKNDVKISYTTYGSGYPVLFLQGSGPGASGWLNFRYNVQHFVDQGYQVIISDLPGFGASDKPDLDYPLNFFE